MALRVLDKTGSLTTTTTASVCIIGAGFAGLVAATRLARDRRRRIIVVESGLKGFDPAISALNEIEDTGSDRFTGSTQSRFRGLGGTSLLWSGKLLPLSASDTRPRPYLNGGLAF